MTSLVAQTVEHLPTMWETQVQTLSWEDPLEKEIATHSSTLAWKIPYTEEHGRLLQSMGSQRVGHDWATSLTHPQLNFLVQGLFPWPCHRHLMDQHSCFYWTPSPLSVKLQRPWLTCVRANEPEAYEVLSSFSSIYLIKQNWSSSCGWKYSCLLYSGDCRRILDVFQRQ